MTHDCYGRTTQRTNGTLTHRVSPTGAAQHDGAQNKAVRIKIWHYRQIYTDRSHPVVFLPVVVRTLVFLPVTPMGTLHGCFSCTHIVKLVFWPENYLEESYVLFYGLAVHHTSSVVFFPWPSSFVLCCNKIIIFCLRDTCWLSILELYQCKSSIGFYTHHSFRVTIFILG
jgi:hypothetical protein